jgi:hypothetical protein
VLYEGRDRGIPSRAPARATRGVVDALVVGHEHVWVVVATQGEDLGEWFDLPSAGEGPAALRLCRGFRGRNTLLLGDCDAERDGLLSEILARD